MFLITGANGYLGSEFAKQCSKLDKTLCLTKDTLDIRDAEKVHSLIERQVDTKYIINCAASVNIADMQKDPQWASQITVEGPTNLARACKLNNKKLIHFSSDYVFDGKKNVPYQEFDRTNGISIYGKLKAQSERALEQIGGGSVVIRTAWLFKNGSNDFIGKIIKLAKEKSELAVVNDQIGSPTYIPDLVEAVLKMISTGWSTDFNIYHVTNNGIASWYDLAAITLNYLKSDVRLRTTCSKEFEPAIQRPSYSVLDNRKLFNDFKIEVPHYYSRLLSCIEMSKNDKNY